MGADYYESSEEQRVNAKKGLPKIGIGEGSIIQNAIIDQNVRIGRNVSIVNKQGIEHYDHDNYSIRGGLVIIHKNAAIPNNTVI